MVLKKIFGRSIEGVDEDREDYVDFNHMMDRAPGTEGKTTIKIDKLTDYKDAERIQKEVREGRIIIAETETLKEKDVGELRRAIERIRKTVIAINGDIVMGPKSMLIICPSSAVVLRSK